MFASLGASVDGVAISTLTARDAQMSRSPARVPRDRGVWWRPDPLDDLLVIAVDVRDRQRAFTRHILILPGDGQAGLADAEVGDPRTVWRPLRVGCTEVSGRGEPPWPGAVGPHQVDAVVGDEREPFSIRRPRQRSDVARGRQLLVEE